MFSPPRALRLAAAVLLATVAACNADSRAHVGSDAERELTLYLTDADFRSRALSDSLVDRQNGYATLRLAHYGRDWEDLPVSRPRVVAVHDGALDDESEDNANSPWELEGGPTAARLLEIGRIAFDTWPGQPLPQVDVALENLGAATAAQLHGLWRGPDGRLGGLVRVYYPSGGQALAGTCATCHARVVAGEVVHGPAADIAFGPAGDGPAAWGSGKVDVTPDGEDNPVAIPDLRATAHQHVLHATGNIKNDTIALAIRIETLLVTNAQQRFRPPREVALGLALYIQALGEAQRTGAPCGLNNQGEAAASSDGGTDGGGAFEGCEGSACRGSACDARADAQRAAGKQLFETECGGCHADATGAGDWVPVSVVGTDGAAAASSTRGTGGYRVPSLWRVGERVQLLHVGYRGGLRAFLDVDQPDRESLGHAFGAGLGAVERDSLVAYLSTL